MKEKKPRGCSINHPFLLVVGVPCDVVEKGARGPPVLIGERLVHALFGFISRSNGVTPVKKQRGGKIGENKKN